MALERWVDFSKWQGPVSVASLQAMKADGIVGVCVGSWHGIDANPHVELVLHRARALGLLTATYVIINARAGATTVRLGRAACGAEWDHLTFVSPDVEVQGVTEAILRDAIAEIERLGHRPLMYTGNWFWNWWALALGHFPDVGNPDAWIAVYNGRRDLNVPTRPGYGPIVAHQYTGSTAAYGTTVDFNVFDSAWVGETPPPPPSPPSPSSPSPPVEEELMGKITDMLTAFGRELEAEIDAARKLPAPIPGPPGRPGPQGPPGPPGGAPSAAVYDELRASDRHATGFAQRHGISLDQLKALNPNGPPSGDWNVVRAGERYRIA